MRPVLISLVITTYNRAELLAGALKSVAASQFDGHGDVEVIVVDNNSNDGTRQTVENIREAGFPFLLRYVVEPNQGLSYARNRGQHRGTLRGLGLQPVRTQLQAAVRRVAVADLAHARR